MSLEEYGISRAEENDPRFAHIVARTRQRLAQLEEGTSNLKLSVRTVEEKVMGITGPMASSMSKMLNEHGVLKEAINIFSGLQGMLERAKNKTGIDFFMEKYLQRDDRDRQPLQTYEQRLQTSIHNMMISANVKEETGRKSQEIYDYVMSKIPLPTVLFFNENISKLNTFLARVVSQDSTLTNQDIESSILWCERLEGIVLGKNVTIN